MLNLVDIKKGLYDAEAKRRRHFILFLLSTILALVLIVVLMITSTRNYFLELLFTVIISIIYLIYVIFYVTIIRRTIKAELRLYNGANNAELSEYNVEIISFNNELKEYNGLEYYTLEAKVIENLKEENKVFYVPKKFSFKKNQKAIFYVFGSILINVELGK